MCTVALAALAACDGGEPHAILAGSAPPDGDVVEPDRYNAFRFAEAIAAGAAPDSAEADAAARTLEFVFAEPIDLTSFDVDAIEVFDSTCGEARPLSFYVEPHSLRFWRAYRQPAFGEGGCDPGSSARTCDAVSVRMRPAAVRPGTDLTFRFRGDRIRRYTPAGSAVPFGGVETVAVSVRTERPAEAPVLIGYTLRLAGEGGTLPGLVERGAGGALFFPPSGAIEGEFDRAPARLSAILEDARGRAIGADVPLGGPNGPPRRGDRRFRVDRAWTLGERVRFELATDDHLVELGTPDRFRLGAPTQGASGARYVSRIGWSGRAPAVDVTSFSIAHVRIDETSCPVAPTSGPFRLRATRTNAVASVEVWVGPADGSAPPVRADADVAIAGERVDVAVDAAALAGDSLLLVRAVDEAGESLGSDRITVAGAVTARTAVLDAAIRAIKARGPHYYDLTAADRACFDALVAARQRRRGRSAHHSPACAAPAPFPSEPLDREAEPCKPSLLLPRQSR